MFVFCSSSPSCWNKIANSPILIINITLLSENHKCKTSKRKNIWTRNLNISSNFPFLRPLELRDSNEQKKVQRKTKTGQSSHDSVTQCDADACFSGGVNSLHNILIEVTTAILYQEKKMKTLILIFVLCVCSVFGMVAIFV